MVDKKQWDIHNYMFKKISAVMSTYVYMKHYITLKNTLCVFTNFRSV